MSTSTGKIRARQAVGSFHEAGGLHEVVKVLADQGVAASDLTVMVGRVPLDDRFLPHMRGHPGTMLDGALANMRQIGTTAGAGHLLVSSSPFSDRLAAAAVDRTRSAKPFLISWLSARHAGYLHQQLDAGAALLCIHVQNGEEEKRAGRALLEYSKHQVQLHDFSFPDPTPPTAA